MERNSVSEKSDIISISLKEIRKSLDIKGEVKDASVLGNFLILKMDKSVTREDSSEDEESEAE